MDNNTIIKKKARKNVILELSKFFKSNLYNGKNLTTYKNKDLYALSSSHLSKNKGQYIAEAAAWMERLIEIRERKAQQFYDIDSYVYFIGSLEYGFVKIGFSINPYKRLSEIQTGCPFKCDVLHMIKGDKKLEKKYHKLYRMHNTFGEWFKIEGDIKEIINIKPSFQDF